MIGNDDGGWVEVGVYLRASDAESGALALVALGIASRLVHRDQQIALFVPADVALRARRELAEYNRENLPRAAQALPPLWSGLDGALAYSALLILVHVAATKHMFGLDWWEAGYSGADFVVRGEWWRAFTALTLHADIGHLASNIFAGSMLGLLLAQALGPGLGWLMILLAGGLGNALNAAVEPSAHASIGASTAIFGTLGFLAALMWRRQTAFWMRGLRTWAPLAAGVMLLVFLGFGGQRTDIGAHIAGFAVGIAAGAGFYFFGERVPRNVGAQYAYGVSALALIALSWLVALLVR